MNNTTTSTSLAAAVDPKHPPADARYIDHAYGYLLRHYNSIDLTLGGSLVLHTVTYWSVGIGLLLFELGFPSVARRYKTQPNTTVTGKQILKLLKRVIPNQILLVLLALGVRRFRPTLVDEKLDKQVIRAPPSYARIAGDYLFNLGVFEVVFYVLHRALHDLRWYKYVHKIHHEFKAPIGLAAEYAHIVELILSNIIPGAIGPALSNAHPLSTWVWMVGSLVQTCFHHSGLMLPFYPLNQWTIAHDWHHKAFTDQFGVVGAMDSALKTTGDVPYTAFSNEIWNRTAYAGKLAGQTIVRVATMAIMAKRSKSKRMPSDLFSTLVR